MKYLKLLLLPLLVVPYSLGAGAPQLRDKEIDKKAVVIEARITRDLYIAYGLTALGYAQTIHMFGPTILSWFAKNPQPIVAVPVVQPSEVTIEPLELKKSESKPLFDAVSEGLKNFGNNTKNLFCTRDGWWTIAKSGFNMGAYFSSLFIMDRMTNGLIHPDTLRWYMYAYVPYKTTIEVMQEVIEKLEDTSIELVQIIHNKQVLRGSVDRLARYGESICAYIKYKTTCLPVEEKLIAERAGRYLFNYYNDWLRRIYAHLDSDTLDCVALKKLIASYNIEMASQLRHFSAIEGESVEDRRQIKSRL